MIVGSVEKQPRETYLIGIDFKDRLASGETITIPTVTAKNRDTGVNSSAEILSGSPVVAGSILSHRVTGGQNGTRHIIEFLAGTNQGNALEDEAGLSIIEF